MTDMTGSRLWPLALMGWLAAFPPVPKDAAAATPPVEEAEETERCAGPSTGQRTAWLHAARARYAALTAEERDSLRQLRRAARAEAQTG